MGKHEALSTRKLIQEVLCEQLQIPSEQIVNDTTFSASLKMSRPDILVSDVALKNPKNETEKKQFLANLIMYAEIKDDECSVGDSQWLEAKEKGKEKAEMLKMPYYVVSNCKTAYYYNTKTAQPLTINGNPLREFSSLDVLRIIKRALMADDSQEDIKINVDTQSSLSESTFKKKLWELAIIYRELPFKNITEKIDFTIGFIAAKVFEEQSLQNNTIEQGKDYWSDFSKSAYIDSEHHRFIVSLCGYIDRLEEENEVKEFKDLMSGILIRIKPKKGDETTFSIEDTVQIFQVIDSMGRLHSSGFDLFGAVYEMFASNKEKSDFGEFFTRRHYTHILSKLLLRDEVRTPIESKITILDPACGTGGFLTEAFKVLRSRYTELGYEQKEFMPYLKGSCLYGFDVKPENVSRSKLNMFLVGDGQVLISQKNTLSSTIDAKFKYILSNPPMGKGTIRAEMEKSNSKRMEIGFIFKIINLLEVDGKACVIMPDGFLENPSFGIVRQEMLEKCIVEAVISLPRFAFAPYTKEKTFAIYLKKKPSKQTQLQSQPVWMYIIDNDGYANSDRRFPTKLRSENNAWMHDEISSWVDKNGEEKLGLLEERWMNFDDSGTKGTKWIDENGNTIFSRKGGVVNIDSINASNFFNIMPEFHLGRLNKLKADAVKSDSIAYDTIEEMLVKLKELESKHSPEHLTERMKQYSFEELFGSATKGQQKLTEEAIYNSIKEADEFMPIWGGNQEHETINNMVSVTGKTKDGKPIKAYKGDCIILSMDGSAGCMTYKKSGQKFTINHHAALLYAKEKDVVNLQYFKLKYESTFKSLAVSDGSKTISIERIKELNFMLPDKHVQDALVERFEMIRVIQNGLLGKRMAIELEVNV